MTPFHPFSQLYPIEPAPASHKADDQRIVIVGAGLAGLFAALKIGETSSWPVVLLSPGKLGISSASSWAQGGIAAAVGPDDSVRQHAGDTLAAGAGLGDPIVAEVICAAAPLYVRELAGYGVPFDRQPEMGGNPTGQAPYALSREAAHSAKRVLHCTGDSSGRLIMESLIAAVRHQSRLTVWEGVSAQRLMCDSRGQVCGVTFRSRSPDNCASKVLGARAVVLACGGMGALYEATTNPRGALGQGLGMAALAGAVLADSEFVQFHPTALDVPENPQPLASEALRGEGATLLNAAGQRFMRQGPEAQEAAELAPRDIVARALFRARCKDGVAYLDCRQLCHSSAEFEQRFPTLWQSARRHGLNPQRDLLPVLPAAHYHMGGVATDLRARSSVPGLWAIGEVACTGLHGANRLASNSLLEAVVMAGNAATDIFSCLGAAPARSALIKNMGKAPQIAYEDSVQSRKLMSQVSPLMSQWVGVERSRTGLLAALRNLRSHCPPELLRTAAEEAGRSGGPQTDGHNALVAALAIGCAALLRSESRGSHYYLPEQNPAELPKELQSLLQRHCSNGQRSFIDWELICEILQTMGEP